ncbi:MAG: DNA alkylation repair protein [Actinobacteria bacterium]|nr:DNA alkylation repair protein [Actinomycetota bacterium]MCB8997003.1 DNA alkylation repair protein [Actinomycetota bacterium]MCB9414006.1 DNA alkylation repair protein [Actinomycetota bacterium]MCB9424515.1 DNA alkylation repair protein [Actinomycetota bacterium]HRY11479.1 DNA alkylation repair protein [Candidatus Nanopelagicales bacterium]
MLADDIRAALADMADPVRAPDMQRYMKSQMPYLGAQKTRLTRTVMRMAKGIDRVTMLATATDLWNEATYREHRYAAIAVLRAGSLEPEDEPLLRHLITTGAWWDLVDETATHLVGPLREQFDMRAWAVDEDMWIRRAAIICQVGGKGRTVDPDLLSDCIEPNTADRTFWITKAIGWALRDYAYADPAWVRAFVDAHDLAPLSVREATKHL